MDGSVAELEDHFDPKLFIEWLFLMHKAPGSRKLMELAAHLAAVGQPNEHKNRSPKLDAKRPLELLSGGLRD